LLLMFGSALTYFLVSLITTPVSEEKLQRMFPKK